MTEDGAGALEAARARCVALELHAGSYSEWTSSLPFVALGCALPFIFGRYP